MRRLLAWIAGILSIAAFVRWLRRRRATEPVAPQPEPVETAVETDDPAEELRERLAASRADDAPAAEADAEGEGEDDGETGTPASLDERRARVHERAQEAIDAMRDPPEGA